MTATLLSMLPFKAPRVASTEVCDFSFLPGSGDVGVLEGSAGELAVEATWSVYTLIKVAWG